MQLDLYILVIIHLELRIALTNVVGTFHGEKLLHQIVLKLENIRNSGNTDLLLRSVWFTYAIVTHEFREVRSFFMDDADAGQDFTADLVLASVDEMVICF